MLSPDEQSQLRSAISAIQRRASEVLAKSQNSWQAISFIDGLHTGMDTVVAASDTIGPIPECKPGCAYCCSARVEVSDAEALLIARYVHQIPADEKLLLLERLRVQAAGWSDVAGQGDEPHQQPCAFLDDGLCSIYSLRPSVCRKAHSLSVQACETGANQIPQNLTRVVQCEALLAGTNEGFKSAGLPASRNELAAAVLAALVEGAEDAWYQGKPILTDPTSEDR